MQRSSALNIPWSEIKALPPDNADFRIQYGAGAMQFGELRLPKARGTFPMVVFIHGGCWKNEYGVDHAGPISRAISEQGYAVWSPEYRRIGDVGGGWPGTFEDIIKSVEMLRDIAPKHGLDLGHVIVMGHSAGGHLALWLGSRKNLSSMSRRHEREPLPIHGVISLAGISDLVAYERHGNSCASSLPALLGGTSSDVSERWGQVNPIGLLPFGIPVELIHGDLDGIVPLVQSQGFAQAGGGDLHIIEGGGHFDMVAPHAVAFQYICRSLQRLKDGQAIIVG